MSDDFKRFTISITPDMEIVLNQLKKECYDKKSQNEMLKDLIIRGLESLKGKPEDKIK